LARRLVLARADVEVTTNDLRTPFRLAAGQGSRTTAEALIALGCDVQAVDVDGRNALDACCHPRVIALIGNAQPGWGLGGRHGCWAGP